ncbi:MAG: phosphodiester glycosidase family protein [Pyrinomonadaceae bacterium]
MKKLSAFIGVHLCLILFCLCVSAQDFQTLRNGIEYAKITRQSKSADGKDETVVINLLRLDLTKVRLDVVHAMDAAIGLEKTSSIATRHGAFAAINAGFFRIDKSIFEGDDVGLLMIDRRILSEGNGRTALIIKNYEKETYTRIGKPDITLNLLPLNFKVLGVDRERKNDDLVSYSSDFHSTTLTNNDGIEFVVVNNKIMNIFDGKGSNAIPANGWILSASGKFRSELKFLKIGDKLVETYHLENFTKIRNVFSRFFPEDIVSGVPQLIKDGKVDITWQEEKSSKSFVETHHPRTAVAKLKDGKFLMVTVDGRSEESGGMSLYQLANFLLEQGATDAMNLDGGGSSTMFLDGKVVNHPSDKEGERKIGDAILVFPR